MSQRKPKPIPDTPCPRCPGSLFRGQTGINAHNRMMHNQPGASQPPLPPLPLPESITDSLLRLRKSNRLIPRVPQAVRIPVATELAKLIAECVRLNSVAAWTRLLTFPYLVLRTSSSTPKTGPGPTVGLCETIRQNLSAWKDTTTAPCDPTPTLATKKKHKGPTPDSANRWQRQSEIKVARGDVRGAVRIVSSTESLAPFNAETLAALRDKHPTADKEPIIPAPPLVAQHTTSIEEITRVIRSFPADSAAGPDGLRPDYLKDLTTKATGEAGTALVQALRDLTNLILAGSVPKECCPVLYGAALIALNKKGGGIRPIAVGCVYRRIVGRVSCQAVVEDLRPLLQPHQLGFATESACEAITHAARQLLNPEPAPLDPPATISRGGIFVKLDCENAFNCVTRTRILEAALTDTPKLFPSICQAYGAASNLFFGSDIIKSEVGLQQGDPFAPALFCAAINPLVRRLKSLFNAWYLDDGTLAGRASTVLQDLEEIIRGFAEIGLRLNPSKCEILVMDNEDQESVTRIKDLLPGVRVISRADCNLLGAPITDEALPAALQAKFETINLLVSRLAGIQPHIAFYLLRNCLTIPKLVYTLRSSPAFQEATTLQSFDDAMRTCLESLLNVSLDDEAWRQATLPVSMGGIGVRSVLSLSIPAFLASTQSTSDSTSALLAGFPVIPDEKRALALRTWYLTTGCSEEPISKEQRLWDLPVLIGQSAAVIESASNPDAKARILAAQRKESRAWLSALPSPNLGNLLDKAAVRIALCLRLGIPMCHPHICVCGSPVDKFGKHGLSCRMLAGTIPRHAELNSILKRALATVHVNSILEPAGLSCEDGKGPDGLTLLPWARGKCLVWDATCADTTCKSYIQASSRVAGSAAEKRENYKRSKYNFLENNYIFCPFAVETLGTFGEAALNLVRELGKRIRETTGEARSRLFLTQRISIAIQRGNAIGILASLPPTSAKTLNEIFYL